MAVAWVGDDRGGDFRALVEYDEPRGPFCVLRGPGPVSVEESVAWARSRARKVYVRVGEEFYSAGEEAVRGLPPWLSAAPPAPRASAGSERVEAWRAEARTGWFRADRESVARRLAEAVGRDDRAADAHAARERGFSVSFTLSAASELEANEIAFGVVRSAWPRSRSRPCLATTSISTGSWSAPPEGPRCGEEPAPRERWRARHGRRVDRSSAPDHRCAIDL
jgi:hypothetical protein